MSKAAVAAPPLAGDALDKLKSAGVPLSDCLSCPTPCDDDGDAQDPHLPPSVLRAWSKQDIDFSTPMLGSTKPFLRHCLISTAKSDWPHDVASVQGSVAALLSECVAKGAAGQKQQPAAAAAAASASSPSLPEGCWQTTACNDSRPPTKLTIQNSSHISDADSARGQSVLVLPEWFALTNIPSAEGVAADSEELQEAREGISLAYDAYLSSVAPSTLQARAEANKAGIERKALPYSAVVLLCSHKKRDVRCHLAAQLLEVAFRNAAEERGWQIDERGDDLVSLRGSKDGDEDAALDRHRRQAWQSGLDPAHNQPTLGLFKCSHIGGHRYSGNVIIYLPSGAGVWYGRVDPLRDVPRLFDETISRGLVIPELLRAGINLVRERDDVNGLAERFSGPANSLSSTGQAEQRGLWRW